MRIETYWVYRTILNVKPNGVVEYSPEFNALDELCEHMGWHDSQPYSYESIQRERRLYDPENYATFETIEVGTDWNSVRNAKQCGTKPSKKL